MKDAKIDNHLRMRFSNGVHIAASIHPTDESIKVEAYRTDGYGEPHVSIMDTKYKYLKTSDEFAEFISFAANT